MKKFTAILMCTVLLISGLVFPVNAHEWTAGELVAGYSFSHLYVVTNEGILSEGEEFTPEMFSDELVGSIEDLCEVCEYGGIHLLQLNLKEPSSSNINRLLETVSESEYVLDYELNYIAEHFPVLPESGADIPHYTNSYTPSLSCDDKSETTISKNMLYNPYYQINYNALLAYSVYLASKYEKYVEQIGYIEYYADTYITDVPCYVTLIFKTPPEQSAEMSVRDYNLSILSKYFDEEDILYVGDTVNAAVVCVDSSDNDTIIGMPELKYIGDAFFNDIKWGLLQPMVGSYKLGDVLITSIDSKITAADARYILRYAAGLETPKNSKQFYYCADMNFDNKIDSADARLALRTAAGLEKEYTLLFGYYIEWEDNMLIPE